MAVERHFRGISQEDLEKWSTIISMQELPLELGITIGTSVPVAQWSSIALAAQR